MTSIVKNESITRTDISFQAPTQVKFGIGKVRTLGEELQIEDDLLDATSVLLVTDGPLVGLGIVDRVRAGLGGSAFELRGVFDAVPPDSDIAAVEAAAALINDVGATLVLAVGGGSVLDTAKVAALIARHGGRPHDYEGLFMVPGPCVPIVAVPTTCGTGSEVSAGAVIKDVAARVKMLIASPYLFPRIAVLDPEMLQTLPAHLVAYTGMDAMTHAIEAFVSTECEPFSEALALRAVEMLHDNLPLAAASRDDIDALAKVQIAASMAGIACSNAALGATHAIAHSIGGLRGLHHGLSNAVALPVVMEYNLEARRSRYAALARAMGATAADETELAAAAVQGIRSLNRQLGIPAAYADLGIESSDTLIAEVAECAMNDPCLAFNPRPTEYVDMELLVRGCVMGAKR